MLHFKQQIIVLLIGVLLATCCCNVIQNVSQSIAANANLTVHASAAVSEHFAPAPATLKAPEHEDLHPQTEVSAADTIFDTNSTELVDSLEMKPLQNATAEALIFPKDFYPKAPHPKPPKPIINYTKNINSRDPMDMAASIRLPKGFNPQPPPLKPLLYPFATSSPSTVVRSPGWRPIFQQNPSSSTQRNVLLAPLLMQEPHKVEELEKQFVTTGPIFESVVYGTWKPEPPLQPDQIFDKIFEASESESAASKESAGAGDSFGVLENRGLDYLEDTSSEKLDSPHYSKAPFRIAANPGFPNERKYDVEVEKYNKVKVGRQEITPPPHSLLRENQSVESGAAEVITVNISDPTLLAIAKQINDSMDYTMNLLRSKTSTAVESTWKPFVPDSTTTATGKMWPKDFMSISKEHMVPLREESSNEPESTQADLVNDQGLGYSISPPEMSSINITKMGVPFEPQSSAKEPTICVPLTVRERVVNNAEPQIVDVERVYCFPLPATEADVEMEASNVVKSSASANAPLEADVQMNNLSGYTPTPTARATATATSTTAITYSASAGVVRNNLMKIVLFSLLAPYCLHVFS